MPDPQNDTPQNPAAASFIGLQSYQESQSKFFFGRDEEISHLTTLVLSNTLTIVFGKSGTGKTSLLNAGVFPRLRKEYCLPFRIRLKFDKDSPDLITQIKNVLKAEIDEYKFKVAAYPSTETLWEYFHKELLWQNVTPILVFDQFEEIFTRAKTSHFAKEELENFWEELSNLIENQIPGSLVDQFLNHKEQITYNYKRQPVKVLFAFREEFLPEFESIPSKIPSLKYSRFRLMPMNQSQAYDVITKTWNDKIDELQARKIITYLTSDETLVSIADIEPSLLSQVCFYLEKERIGQHNDKITAEFLDKYPKETILRSIYDEVMDKSYDAIGRPFTEKGKIPPPNPVKTFAENRLITRDGFRIKYALTEDDKNIMPGVEVLKDKYFLRDDGKAVELTHDVLAPYIKEDREERLKKLATIEENKKARRKAGFIILLGLLVGGSIWGYGTYKRNIAQEAEQQAINNRDSLISQINDLRADSTRLSRNNKRNPGSGIPAVIPATLPPTNNPENNDSLRDELKISRDRIANLQMSIDQLDAHINDLKFTYTNLLSENESIKGINAELLKKIAVLERQAASDKDIIARWRTNFEKLQKEFYDYKMLYPQTNSVTNPDGLGGQGEDAVSNRPTIANDLDSNSLKLKLYNTNKAGTFNVYIIPDSSYNRAIARDARYYELRTNEDNLKNKADGLRRAKFSNGYYYFPKLPVGNYIIKICTYYGGFYSYKKTKEGTEVLTKNASPPIR